MVRPERDQRKKLGQVAHLGAWPLGELAVGTGPAGQRQLTKRRDISPPGMSMTGQYVTNVLINNACPGYVATDLNAFNGTQTPEQGVAIAIRLATLPDGGPTGGLSDDTGIVPW